MKALDYLYVGLYRLLLKTSQKDIAEYSAVIFLTAGLSLYMVILLDHLYINPTQYFSAKGLGYAVGILIGGGNYFRYVRGGRYKIIYEDLLKMSLPYQRTCSVVSAAFCIGGLLAIIFIEKAT